MDVTCPHCGESIELVGASELKNEFDLDPNAVQHAREKGTFPEPWLGFGNRNIYLRQDAQRFMEQRRAAKLKPLIGMLEESWEQLPQEERELVRRVLEEKMATRPTPSKRTRRRRN